MRASCRERGVCEQYGPPQERKVDREVEPTQIPQTVRLTVYFNADLDLGGQLLLQEDHSHDIGQWWTLLSVMSTSQSQFLSPAHRCQTCLARALEITEGCTSSLTVLVLWSTLTTR